MSNHGHNFDILQRESMSFGNTGRPSSNTDTELMSGLNSELNVTVKQEPVDFYSPSVNEEKQPVAKRKKMKQEKLTEHFTQRRKHDRFNGLSEQEVLAKCLPDHLEANLDIVIVGINPGLTAAHVGHHYAGPGNHFWKCLYLSGLTPEPLNAYSDYKLKELGIGFTNIVSRTSRSSSDLSRTEIKQGAEILSQKMLKYQPKIAVFNGKGIYEVFCGHKKFYIGRQPELFPGTNTVIYVMPSSSARCSQLPRAVDKLPFYIALRKLRDHLCGRLPNLDPSETIFPDLELKVEPKKEHLPVVKVEAEMNCSELDTIDNCKKRVKVKVKSTDSCIVSKHQRVTGNTAAQCALDSTATSFFPRGHSSVDHHSRSGNPGGLD